MKQRCEFQNVTATATINAALIALLLATASRDALADDWPVARGDTLGTGVARSSLPDGLEVLWTYRAGDDAGYDATAVVVNRIIYIGDNAGTFHAVRLADGKTAWTKTFKDCSFGAAAALDRDRIFVGDMNGVVRCLAIADGTEQWSKNLTGEVYAGPTPHDGNILLTSESGTLSCLNVADGHEVWPAFKIEAPLRCTPTIAAGRVMLAGCDSLLHLINVADGREAQTVEIDAPTGATPAMHAGRVYFGTEGGTFYAIDVPESSDQKPKVAWKHNDPQRGQPIRAAAAVDDHTVVFGSQGKAIYGLELASGEEKWKLPTRSRVESSPVIAGQRVVVATTAGKIYLLDSANGDIKWEYDAGGSFTASPAVVDGRIILGNTDGKLYCFGANTLKSKQLTTESTEGTEKNR